jgi:hypothetical protein
VARSGIVSVIGNAEKEATDEMAKVHPTRNPGGEDLKRMEAKDIKKK